MFDSRSSKKRKLSSIRRSAFALPPVRHSISPTPAVTQWSVGRAAATSTSFADHKLTGLPQPLESLTASSGTDAKSSGV